MYTLEGIGEDVAQYMKGCERLLSARGRHTPFTATEKDVISYYCQELLLYIQSLGDEQEKIVVAPSAVQPALIPGSATTDEKP